MMAARKAKTPPMSDLLPTPAMVDYSARSERTLHRWHDDGLIGKYYVGSRVYWSKTEVDGLVTTARPDSVARSVGAMRAALAKADP